MNDVREELIAAGLLTPAPDAAAFVVGHVPTLVAVDRTFRGVARVELDWRARRSIRRELSEVDTWNQ